MKVLKALRVPLAIALTALALALLIGQLIPFFNGPQLTSNQHLLYSVIGITCFGTAIWLCLRK